MRAFERVERIYIVSSAADTITTNSDVCAPGATAIGENIQHPQDLGLSCFILVFSGNCLELSHEKSEASDAAWVD